MDDIVEKFLLEKLDEEIKGAREAAEEWGTKSRCTKLVSIHNECGEVKKLMVEKKAGTRAAVKETRREKLYYLLNLIAEWYEMLKNQPRALLSFDEILRKVKQVKKELEEKPEEASKKPQQVKTDQVEEEASEKVKTDEAEEEDPQVYRWSSHAATLAEIHGFDEKLMIMERLLCKNAKAVGIVGVAGVGKTALCQIAYNHQPVRAHYPLRIWLCLSKRQNMDHVSFEDQLKRMLSCLGFEDRVIQKVGVGRRLELALRRHLTRGRYLVVLDDVWMVEENEKVVVEKEIQNLFSFLTPYEGTLLLTSRSPELEKMVGPGSMHRLLPLADKDSCWKIFTDAFMGEAHLKPDELENLKDNILEKCDGLPLMAKMLGKIAHQTKSKTTPSTSNN